TAARVAGPRFAPSIVVANAEHRFIVAEQLRGAAKPAPRIVLEPEARNTAPAIAVAALLAAADDPDALILVMPADHVIEDEAAFLQALDRGSAAARAGYLVTFGVRPDRPQTGYGYIEPGAGLDAAPSVHLVQRFVEKPDRATAER